MARISTGQTYGETNRSTAAQLLGGIPTDATSGAIAQSVINEPALRPQASPVSTYQQVGAPTIGGPVKFFAPPDLPAPSQDMARIAAALGGFSPILANLGESYVQRKKDEDARAQLAGQGVAQRLSLTAPGQDFIAARDSLWRQAQAGDASALAAYQQLQALSPLQQAYAQRYAGQAVLREDISTALDRFKTIPDIGGTPIDQIPPGDPRLSAAMASLYRVPANDPAGFAELMPQIAAKNGEISRAHMTMHTARKAQAAGAATQANTVSLFSGNPNAADVAAGITRQLNIARQSLGVEPYQDQLKALPDMLVTAAVVNSIGPDGKPDARRFQALAGVAQQVLAGVRIGPNGQESLLNAYGVKGGVAMQLDLQLKLLAKNKELAGAVNAFAGSAGEDLGHQIAAMTKVGDPSLTPAQRDAALTRGAAMIAAQTSNPQERAAAMSALTSTFNASQAAFTVPMQRAAEREMPFDYAKDPGTEIKRIDSMIRSGQMTPEAGNRLKANYRLLQGAEMQPWVRASREAVEMAMKPEIDAVKLTMSDGGKNITEKERLFLITRRAELTGDVERMRLKALSDGSGVAGYRAQLGAFTKALLPQAPKPPSLDMTPLFTSPEDWQKNLPLGNAGGRGTPQANADLARRVDTGRVMGLPAFTRNFEAWIERGEMSDAMKLMIKRSGYGAKPAEFWRKQWKNQHGDTPMPAEYQGLMPLRDQMKVSYQPAPSTAEPRNQLASNLGSFWQNLSTSAANALMPPAAAGEMPMGAMGQVRLGTPVVGTPKLNANAKAWLAAISAGGFEGAGYNTYYGGGAFDNTKGHPMRVVRPPGGIPSSAAGRYQFMPDTWTGLHGGKNPPMTPANQDTGAYNLALERGVDINTAPPTIENVRKLAAVWAALPVNTTSGAGYYKGQGGAGFTRFRQTWETERRRYSAGA
jgi:muramidase (phage lysozyme)